MTRKFAISLLLVVLGLASVDAALVDDGLGISSDEMVSAMAMQDGTGAPPRP